MNGLQGFSSPTWSTAACTSSRYRSTRVAPDGGLGRALLDHAAEPAAAAGVSALTLTTFADVPWNAPYYVRCGFRVLEDREVTAGLRAIRQREASFGMDRWPRVCVRPDL
jgi:GNAT superfamily N-acetyltransferase